MRTFAFFTYPINKEQLKNFWPLTRIIPAPLINFFCKKASSFKVLRMKNIRSIQGKEIQFYLFVLPSTTRQGLSISEEDALEKILACGNLAQDLGAGLLGLGGYASGVADNQSQIIAKRLKIPVTSGSAFTAWSIFEAIYRMVKIKGVDPKKSTLAIIGAMASPAVLCAKRLSDYVRTIITVSEDRDKLERLKETILHLNPIEVIIEEDAHRAVKDADIVINLDGPAGSIFDIEELKSNAIVCDLSLSNGLLKKADRRRDITVIKGGLIKLPYPLRRGMNTGLAKDIIWASLAEAMLLTFEEKFVSYSLGDSINVDKLEEIADISARHGFEVWVPEAPLL